MASLDSRVTDGLAPLADSDSAQLRGGFANPACQGLGSLYSGSRAALVYEHTPSGVANSNHYFQAPGDGRSILNNLNLHGQGQLIRNSR